MYVYIDGSAGATGLILEDRLRRMDGVTLIKPEEHLRKDPAVRKQFLNEADAVFLCLPDGPACEAVAMVDNPNTVIFDASTAHRVSPDWVYGFPELSAGHEKAVKTSNRIAVPGCHASGFAALVYPAVQGGLIDPDDTLFCHSLTGYSGGGKAMIETYESGSASPSAAKLYSLGLHHKHLPEMQQVCGLKHPPVFTPVLVNVRQGMIVTVPIAASAPMVWEYFNDYYKQAGRISVMPFAACDGLALEGMNDTDNMEIYIFGHESQTVMAARFDNLGKGSSGAAAQCFRLRMGI